jgi:hypothetical protein
MVAVLAVAAVLLVLALPARKRQASAPAVADAASPVTRAEQPPGTGRGEEEPPQPPAPAEETSKRTKPDRVEKKPWEVERDKGRRPIEIAPLDGDGPKKKPPVAAVLDDFGNPAGRDAGLARDGAFAGKRLLAYCNAEAIRQHMFVKDNPLWGALGRLGFEVRLEGGAFQPRWLEQADQLWVFSSDVSGMDENGYAAVEKFIKAGKGTYLLSDDEPLVRESAALVKRLYGGDVKGDYYASKIAVVRGRGLRGQDVARYGRDGYEVDDHALLTGINFFWEGVTISHVVLTDKLQRAVPASDGKCLIATSRVAGQRVVIDCGWTRYYPMFISKTAGTLRLAENVAAHLQQNER